MQWSNLDQNWYDKNRERFEAETTKVDLDFEKCQHKNLKRVSPQKVECSCGAGWIDMGKIKV